MKTRQEVINKIKSILNLQKNTSFEGEASVAANMIDKLCKEYGISLNEAEKVQVLDEVFFTYKKANTAHNSLLNSVAQFYDGQAYITNGEIKSIRIVGTEGQQIQIRLYFEYLLNVMNRECDIAHKAEKVLAEMTGGTVSRSFKINFNKAFVYKVHQRLVEMKKEENRVHEDANAVKETVAVMNLGKARRSSAAKGDGAFAGADVGSTVSLNRQATGSTQRALCGV